jgi:hypothetical protein
VYQGVVYQAVAVKAKLALLDENGNTKTTIDATKNFNVTIPNLGFLPYLQVNLGQKNNNNRLFYLTRSAERQFRFGVCQKTVYTFYTTVVQGRVKNVKTEYCINNTAWWDLLRGKYLPAIEVLKNGGGLDKNYGVTASGDLIFSSTYIGRVTVDKDGVELFNDYFFNSIIREDLEDRLGIKRIVKGVIKNVAKEKG